MSIILNSKEDNLEQSYKEQLESFKDYHNKAMIELAKICGGNVSDEPRFKWVSLLVSEIVAERDSLRIENEKLLALL